MHQADSVLNILESEDDWIDRPLGPQRIVEQHCAPDHRRGGFGPVTLVRVSASLCCCGPVKRLNYMAYSNRPVTRATHDVARVAAGVAFRPYTLV